MLAQGWECDKRRFEPYTSRDSQHILLQRKARPLSDPFERLKAALADRYAIQREIGSGGMATVYLADDLRHRRKVAVKVLRPELAATMGSDRFLHEIEIAAQLQNPHILPLLDSGDAGGFLYYVMPFIEGQTLRDRLVAFHGDWNYTVRPNRQKRL